jgi:NADH dehydrogenase
MKVLVIGGTGFIGTEVSRELLDRGHTVTVLSRTPDTAPLPEVVRTVSGDVTDYGSIEAVFEGQDVVVNLVALSPLFSPTRGDELHDRVHFGGTRNVVRAAEEHGVHRLVQMSALGADPDGPTAYIRSKGNAEAVVRDSALDWVIIRPSVVFGEGGEFVSFTKLLTTPYVTGLPGGGATQFQPIWVGDLVGMLADAVESDDHGGAIYELGGPEVLTLAEVTKRVYRAAGKPVAVLPIPDALARIGLTFTDFLPVVPLGTDQYRSLQFDNTVDDNHVRAFGRSPDDLRTLDEYLDETSEASSPSRSPLTARSTLLVFGVLAIGWFLPSMVDAERYAPLLLVPYVPAYLVTIVLYDGILSLESVVYAIEPFVPVRGAYLWDAGLLVTYYLFAVASTWLGRYLRKAGTSMDLGEDPDEGGPTS